MRSDGRRPGGASAFGVTVGVWIVVLAVLGAVVTTARVAAAAGSSAVEVLHLDGEVNTVAANYLAAVWDRAGRDRRGAGVLVVNTPGGLSTAMDQMVTSLLGAPVPVAAYVAPAGGRTASAGRFVA